MTLIITMGIVYGPDNESRDLHGDVLNRYLGLSFYPEIAIGVDYESLDQEKWEAVFDKCVKMHSQPSAEEVTQDSIRSTVYTWTVE